MGGKKKSAKAPIKQESKYKVPRVFNCPICDAKASIVITMQQKHGRAFVRCRVCGGKPFETTIHTLSLPVDAYFDFYEHVRKADKMSLKQHHIELLPNARTAADSDEADVFTGALTNDEAMDDAGAAEGNAEDLNFEALFGSA